MSLAIEINNVEIRRARRLIFSGVSLQIAAGERIALTGPSGIGKSTLLAVVAGLLSPTRGSVVIGGKQVTGPTSSVTLMQQRPALLPWASALDNVALGLRFASGFRLSSVKGFGSSHKKIQDISRVLLAQVGLQGYEHARPAELSGGQQQRVALARALALRPSILLLDEPFSQLDPVSRKQLRQDVRQLAEERGITVILVTHDLTDAQELCHKSYDFAAQSQTKCHIPTRVDECADNTEQLYAAVGI